MKHLEIELKTLLKKDEYDRLKEQFTGVTPVLQKNYYIDTPDFDYEKRKSLCVFELLTTGQN